MQYIVALFYYLGSAGVAILVLLAVLFLSLSKSNISDANEIGSLMLLLSFFVPIAMQSWKDDLPKIKEAKKMGLYLWYNTLVAFFSFLIFLSGSHFVSLLFIIFSYAFIIAIDNDSNNLTLYDISITNHFLVTISSLSIWTFIAAILCAYSLNLFFPYICCNCLEISNGTFLTGFLFALPFMAMAVVLIFLCFKYTIGFLGVLILNILFNYSNFINSIKKIKSSEKSNSNIIRNYQSIFYIIPLLFHILAFFSGVYLTKRREFVVFITNFQISNVSVDDTAYYNALYISLTLIFTMIIGQKILKSKYKENYSLKHFLIFIYPIFWIILLISIITPFSNLIIEDPTDSLAIRFANDESTYNIKCPICHNDDYFNGKGTLFLYNNIGGYLYCDQCEDKWYVHSLDTIKKANRIISDREEAEEKICRRLNALKTYPNWQNYDGDWKKCRKQFLKPYEEDKDYVKGYAGKKKAMPKFVGDTLWIYDSFYYDYPENEEKLANAMSYIIKDCRLNRVNMAAYVGGAYKIIYDKKGDYMDNHY